MSRRKVSGWPCGVCGTKTRRKFPIPHSQKGRRQHPRFWVCESGHELYQKER